MIAIDRRDRRVGAMLLVLHGRRTPLRTSSAVVAQVWRQGARQANLARVLAGIGIASLAPDAARRIGELLAVSGTGDIVDGHVALLVEADGMLLTSDAGDLSPLLGARRIRAKLVPV